MKEKGMIIILEAKSFFIPFQRGTSEKEVREPESGGDDWKKCVCV